LFLAGLLSAIRDWTGDPILRVKQTKRNQTMHVPLNILADVGGTFWLPPRSSSYADDVDWLFWFIMAVSIIFFVLITVLVVVFVWKYRYRPGVPMQDAPKHNTALELTWTFVPTVLVIIIFVYGFKGYLRMTVPPPNAYEIIVNGKMWKWTFQYPNGHQDDELHLPVGVPISFILSSDDVIHSFAIPAFRVKKDVVPGRYNRMWAQPDEAGDFDIFCDQYCGDQHSLMRTKVTVQSKVAFNTWLEKVTNIDYPTPADHGKVLYTKKGCNGCHAIDNSPTAPKIGPSWVNLYLYPVNFSDGKSPPSVIADEDYLRSMIVNPNNRTVAGFSPIMPNFQGQLKDKTHDVDDLIAFIKTLSDKYHPTGPTSGPTTAPTSSPAPPVLPAARAN
jgi:cytochrome c oxidase subunit 2